MASAQSYLDQPTLSEAGLAAGGSGDGLIGQRVGPYQILELLGEGGMGTVYLAEQREPVNRLVALKLMRGALTSTLSRAYFEVECQSLARMEHPAIARLYDAGTTDLGRPYLVMERVDGEPLHDYCRRLNLDLTQRLTLFERLCLGVQHVHQHGLIHRDLKPANVLVREVDGTPWPTLIDFGLAIAAQQDDQRRGSGAEGTEIYMSPEQARGEHRLDTRSDVYALGVMLLQLLADEPFGSAVSTGYPHSSWHALLLERHRREESREWAALSATIRRLPRGLRWILGTALAPLPGDRYPSAIALSEDLERWLEHRPLKVAPASRVYRLRLFLRRQRLPIIVGGALLLALLGGLASTQLALRQTQQALERADREAAKANQVAQFLGSVLSSIDPTTARDLDKTLLRKVLNEAAQRAESELAGQPEVRAEIDYAIGRSYWSLVDAELSLPFLRRAWEAARVEHDELATASIDRLVVLVDATLEAGHADQAKALAEAALTMLEEAGLGQRKDAINLRISEAVIVKVTDGPAAALAKLEAIAEAVRTHFEQGSARRISFEIELAVASSQMERFDQAEAIYQSLVDDLSERVGYDHPRTLTVRAPLAILAMDQQRWEPAIAMFAKLVPAYAKVFGDDHLMTLAMRSNYAGALRQGGRVADSEPHYRAAYEGITAKLGRDHVRSVMVTHNYANYLLDSGDWERAIELQQQALDGLEVALPGNAWARSEILGGIGRAETAARRWGEAQAHLEQSLADKRSVLGENHARVASSLDDLIALHRAWGAHPEQLAMWQAQRAKIEGTGPRE